MRTFAILSIGLLIVRASFSSAQIHNPPKKSGGKDTMKRVRIVSISLQAGLPYQGSNRGALEDFRALAPQNEHLKKDFTEYSSPSSGYGSPNVRPSAVWNLRAALWIRNKEGDPYPGHPRFRIGLSAFRSLDLINSWGKEELIEEEQFISQGGGETITRKTVRIDDISWIVPHGICYCKAP